MARDYIGIATGYIADVLSGKIPACQLVKQACQRQLDDLAREGTDDFPYVFAVEPQCRRCKSNDPIPSCRRCKGTGYETNPATRVCAFIENLPHIEGDWDDATLVLEPWQCFGLTTIFGWVHRETLLRRFRKALWVIPVRNGKSMIGSCVGLYLLTADGESGPQIASAGTTKDQSKVVWNIASAMVRKMPDLQERYGVKAQKHSIFIERENASFIPLSREAKTLEGKNLHGVIIDELAQHKNREVFDTLSKRTGSRKQPLTLMISTEGDNAVGVFAEQVDYVTKILGGLHRDDAYYGIIYTIDKTADWSDPISWRCANPNIGVSVTVQSITDAFKEALSNPAAQSSFMTRILNVRVGAGEAYINMMSWKNLCTSLNGSPWAERKKLSIEQFEGDECILALDLATKNDIAAKVVLFREGRYFALFGKFYCPEIRLDKSSGNPNYAEYTGWKKLGFITTTPGNVIDFEKIEEDLLEDCSRFRVREVGFDPWQATELSTRMRREGVNMVEIPMQVKQLSEPMKAMQSLIDAGRLKHDNNPVMSWMFGNLIAQTDFKENVFPRKSRPANKIDGAVATIMALSRSIIEGEGGSFYDDNDLRYIG